MISAAATEFLLIDISNSFTKYALATREEISEPQRVPTPKLSSAPFRDLTVGTVVLSSVVPHAERKLGAFLRGRRVLNVSTKLQLGVGVEYPEPASIGADRLANAAAAAVFYGAPSVVVDFGTAVTFDIISRERNYLGGVIAPGLEAMTSYLYQRTALLPKIDLSEPSTAIGKSTREAMLAGAVFGYRGLVREILGQIRRELRADAELQVVATGGYAELIAQGLPEIARVHPHLTLEGLRIIGGLNS
jgi:type III pantothenate kinase